MPIIIMTIIITFLILIVWTYRSLGDMETNKKILCIIAEFAVILIGTSITYMISKSNIQYPNKDSMLYVQNTLILLFSGINGLFIMPFLSRGIEMTYQENITLNQLGKRIILCTVILLFLLIFECGYMTTTQDGILRIMMGK